MPSSASLDLDDLSRHPTTVALGSLVVVSVWGDEAESFLQGQFSNDVAALGDASGAAAGGQLNAYCNPKGRVLALLRVVRCAGGFWLVVPAGLAERLVARLKMFVLRAKVEIELQPHTGLLGVINPAEIGPADVGAEVDDDDGFSRVSIDGILPRQLLIGAPAAIDSFTRAGGYAQRPDDAAWRLLDILSGVPQVYAQTAEQFIPQMINLDLVGGLSFTKGCYPGQEIIARLRYRGKVKQRMLAGVARVASLAPGDLVYCPPPDDPQADPKKAGLVVDAVKTGDAEYTFSATAPADRFERGELVVGASSSSGASSTPTSTIQRIPLPYADWMQPLPADKVAADKN